MGCLLPLLSLMPGAPARRTALWVADYFVTSQRGRTTETVRPISLREQPLALIWFSLHPRSLVNQGSCLTIWGVKPLVRLVQECVFQLAALLQGLRLRPFSAAATSLNV